MLHQAEHPVESRQSVYSRPIIALNIGTHHQASGPDVLFVPLANEETEPGGDEDRVPFADAPGGGRGARCDNRSVTTGRAASRRQSSPSCSESWSRQRT